MDLGADLGADLGMDCRRCRWPEDRLATALSTPELAGAEIDTKRVVPRELAKPELCVRVPRKPSLVSCQLCLEIFAAQGPTGHLDDAPICDRCLLEQESQLG